MGSIDIVVPVVGRPQNARPFMESFLESGARELGAIVLPVVEEGDRESLEAWSQWEGDGASVIVEPSARTFAEKANAAFARTGGEWLFLVGDDVRFHPGWLGAALGAAADGASVVGTNDLLTDRVRRGDHATHMLVSRRYVEEVGAGWDGPGVLCHPYRHWYVDDEIVAAAKQRGAWAPCPEAVVEHVHHLDGKVEKDSVYAAAEAASAADRAEFEERAIGNRARIPMLELGGGPFPHPFASVVVDLEHPRGAPAQDAADAPWRTDRGTVVDGSVSMVYASHIMTQIPRGEPLLRVMNEAWRVLEPGGTFKMVFPVVGYTDMHGVGHHVESWQAYADPTHVSLWWMPQALSLYFCKPDLWAGMYGALPWEPLGRYFEYDDIDWEAPTFWSLRWGWECTVRIRKPGAVQTLP
jgi:hypothetical protein